MRWLALLSTVAIGCGGGYVYMDDDLPSESCPATEGEVCETTSGGSSSAGTATTSTTSTDTTGQSDSCDVAGGCEAGFCAAPFDGDVGEFTCVPACIGIMDEAWWCADASACCDAQAVCTDRGYCVIAGEGESSSSSGNGSSGSDTGSDGGSGSSDSGSSSGGI